MSNSVQDVLIVEDDPAHVEIVKRKFAETRIANKVVFVHDGQEALDYVFHEGKYTNTEAYPRPGLILLDLRLPKVDGLEVLSQIKSDPELASIPVVILTATALEKDMADSYKFRANGYVKKPLDLDGFTKLLETLGYYWLLFNTQPNGRGS